MADWSTTAFIFPGQGSQAVGMGQAIAEAFPAAQEIYQRAEAILGYNLSDLCFNGPEDQLNQTTITQPAVYTTSIAILTALQTVNAQARPSMVAGHSFGQITALAAAGTLTFEDGLNLARERGRLMHAANELTSGAMAALLGLDIATVSTIVAQAVEQTGGVLVVANDNCPGQVVISGDSDTLSAALVLAEEHNVRKAVRLPISIAAHSPLMQPVADEFAEAVRNTPMQPPQVPVYGNISAAPITDMAVIRSELEQQLTGAVRWTESVQAMVADGATRFVEVGTGEVLSGLVKRIDRKTERVSLDTPAAIEALANA